MSISKYGFIGCGNMGGSLARAVCKAVGSNDVLLADKATEKAQFLADELKCSVVDVKDIAGGCKYIFLGVKPQVMKDTLDEISAILKERDDRYILISMAAGIEVANLKGMLGFDCPIIRIMPNTPVSAGKGMIVYSFDESVSAEEINEFTDALQYTGKLDEIDEGLINSATAVSGCGPAFVYLFAEAMADAGAQCGLPYDKALEYTFQTIAGAAELMQTSGKHPSVLRDEVCSPGGSTIEGVHALEDNEFRGTVMSAINSSFKRTKELAEK